MSLFPPHWRADGVSIGDSGQIKAQRVNARVGIGGLFGTPKSFDSLEFESPVIKEQALAWLFFGKPQGQGISMAKVSASNATLDSEGISLPRFDVRADMAPDGNWQKIVLESSNKDIYVELHPSADRVQFDMTGTTFLPPFGGTLQLEDFSAKGSFSRNEMAVSDFNGRNYGGSLTGTANLKWSGNWSIDGTVNAKQVDATKLAPAILSGGRVDGRAAFTMQARDAKSLFAAPHVEGTFTIGQGELLGFDIMHALQNFTDTGKTGFRELAGNFVRDGDVTQIRQMRMDAGILSVTGSAELGANDVVRGRFATSYQQRASGSLSLSGTVQVPKFSR
jgi:hypothetical protein